MTLSALEIRYVLYCIFLLFYNQTKHTKLNHLCFQNSFYKMDVSGFHGNGGDAFARASPNGGIGFTTYDQDHDESTSVNCASNQKGAWWWKTCGHVNLNGYNYGYAKKTADTMSWYWFGETWECLKTISMAIKPIRL